MNAAQRKVIRDHARAAGHLVTLWDASDFRWYRQHRMKPGEKIAAEHNGGRTK